MRLVGCWGLEHGVTDFGLFLTKITPLTVHLTYRSLEVCNFLEVISGFWCLFRTFVFKKFKEIGK